MASTEVVFWASNNIWKYVCLSKESVKIKKIEKGKKIQEGPSLEQLEKSIANMKQKLKDEFNKLKEIISGPKGEGIARKVERKEKEEIVINLRNKIKLLEEYKRVKENPII